MAKHPPAYQYYPADFEGATRHWTPAEVGCYQRLLNHQWINGPLPKDRLWRIAGASKDEWGDVWETLCEKFVESEGGGLVNERLERVRDDQREYRRRKSEAGRLGGIASAKQRSSSAEAVLEQSQSNSGSERQALQSSSSSSLSSTSNGKERSPAANAPAGFDEFWQAYPRKQAKKDARKAWKTTAKGRPDLPDLLSVLEDHKKSEQWRENVIPLPATWLRGERWADEMQKRDGESGKRYERLN